MHSLDIINDWCINNKLFLNNKKNTIKHDYILESNVLSRPEIFTKLGVVFDDNLSFTHHINHIVGKSFKSLGFLIRNTLHFSNALVSNFCIFLQRGLIWNMHQLYGRLITRHI